jgi:hypothetical protein
MKRIVGLTVLVLLVATFLLVAVCTRYEIRTSMMGRWICTERVDRWTGEVEMSLAGMPWTHVGSPKPADEMMRIAEALARENYD